MTSPEQTIRDGKRVEAFLKDDVIAGALSRMERRYYEEFIAAESAEQRVRAWAKAKTLRDFESELKVLTDRGHVEAIQAEKAKPKPLI